MSKADMLSRMRNVNTNLNSAVDKMVSANNKIIELITIDGSGFRQQKFTDIKSSMNSQFSAVTRIINKINETQ